MKTGTKREIILSIVVTLLIISGFFYPVRAAEQKSIILATTTSTQDSGLLDALLPVFEKKTGYFVKTIAVGSGQAMAMGQKGEADVMLVHSPAAEKKFVE
ncbi:MAG: tungsten ABC transporter substrate-binding protein, partial [Syntrophobacterales bacterium CG_4_8_14_3_um_filter_49_14]